MEVPRKMPMTLPGPVLVSCAGGVLGGVGVVGVHCGLPIGIPGWQKPQVGELGDSVSWPGTVHLGCSFTFTVALQLPLSDFTPSKVLKKTVTFTVWLLVSLKVYSLKIL